MTTTEATYTCEAMLRGASRRSYGVRCGRRAAVAISTGYGDNVHWEAVCNMHARGYRLTASLADKQSEIDVRLAAEAARAEAKRAAKHEQQAAAHERTVADALAAVGVPWMTVLEVRERPAWSADGYSTYSEVSLAVRPVDDTTGYWYGDKVDLEVEEDPRMPATVSVHTGTSGRTTAQARELAAAIEVVSRWADEINVDAAAGRRLAGG